MKNKKIFFLFSFVLVSCFVVQLQARSLTVESDEILDVLKYVDKNTLVIFDIDGVVFEPSQTLGNDPWAFYEGDKFIKSVGDFRKGLLAFLPLWVEVRKKVGVKIVSENLHILLNELENRGIKVIGFTSRGTPLVEATKRDLNSIGVDFTKNSYHKSEEESEKYRFVDGILFIDLGFYPKGDILKCFFEKIKKRPSKIIFIDDRIGNIKSLEKMCKEEKIDFVGIRYSATDKSRENFNNLIGDTQLYFMKKFDKILTDEQTENMLSFFENLIKNGGDFCREI